MFVSKSRRVLETGSAEHTGFMNIHTWVILPDLYPNMITEINLFFLAVSVLPNDHMVEIMITGTVLPQ